MYRRSCQDREKCRWWFPLHGIEGREESLWLHCCRMESCRERAVMIRDLQEDTTLLKPILIHNLWMPNRHVHITVLICPTWSLWKLQTALTHVITCFVWREGFLLRRHEYLWRLERPSIKIISRVSVAFFSLDQLLLPCCSPPPLFTPPKKIPSPLPDPPLAHLECR